MDRFGPGTTVLLIALLGACGPPHLAKPAGTRAAGAAAPGASDASTAPPAFSLPDAATPPAAPDAAAAPATGACVGQVHEAESGPVDLLLLMDSSGSMGSFVGPRSRWENAQMALSAFIRDPSSAGLGVGLHFFPSYLTRPCTTDQDCAGIADFCVGRSACPGPNPMTPGTSCIAPGPAATTCPGGAACIPTGACTATGALCTNLGQPCRAGAGTCQAFPRICFGNNEFPNACKMETYRDPAVAIGPLPASQEALVTAMNGHFPEGATPMEPAARGALAYLKTHRMANPNRRAALVLVTDGLPSMGCAGNAIPNDIPGVASTLAEAVRASPIIRTYVIGMFPRDQLSMVAMQVDQLASAGGTDKAIVLAVNTDFTAQLQAALNQVRGSLGCEYQIPAAPGGALIDFGKVNVHYTGQGISEDVPYVESRDRCDPMRGGWYYDVPPASGVPTRIVTCDATCGRLRATQTGKVDLVFGCGTRGID